MRLPAIGSCPVWPLGKRLRNFYGLPMMEGEFIPNFKIALFGADGKQIKDLAKKDQAVKFVVTRDGHPVSMYVYSFDVAKQLLLDLVKQWHDQQKPKKGNDRDSDEKRKGQGL